MEWNGQLSLPVFYCHKKLYTVKFLFRLASQWFMPDTLAPGKMSVLANIGVHSLIMCGLSFTVNANNKRSPACPYFESTREFLKYFQCYCQVSTQPL